MIYKFYSLSFKLPSLELLFFSSALELFSSPFITLNCFSAKTLPSLYKTESFQSPIQEGFIFFTTPNPIIKARLI